MELDGFTKEEIGESEFQFNTPLDTAVVLDTLSDNLQKGCIQRSEGTYLYMYGCLYICSLAFREVKITFKELSNGDIAMSDDKGELFDFTIDKIGKVACLKEWNPDLPEPYLSIIRNQYSDCYAYLNTIKDRDDLCELDTSSFSVLYTRAHSQMNRPYNPSSGRSWDNCLSGTSCILDEGLSDISGSSDLKSLCEMQQGTIDEIRYRCSRAIDPDVFNDFLTNFILFKENLVNYRDRNKDN